MRIFLTGGTGFIGSALAKQLLARQHTVYALHRGDSFASNMIDGIEYVKGDLLEGAFLETSLRHIQPEIIVHVAAYTPVRFSFANPAAYAQINYIGTMNLVEAARKVGGVSQIVYASTAEIYGPYRDDRKSSEETLPEPSTPYGISKLAGEHYVKYSTYHDIRYTCLRPTNTFGRTFDLPDEARGYFIEKLIIGMLLSPHATIPFDGSPESKRRFMYVSDHISAYTTVISNPHAYDRTYNVAPADAAMKLSEVVDVVKGVTDFRGDVSWMNDPRPVEPNFLDIDPFRFMHELGWHSRISLKAGLEKAVEYWKKKLMNPP
jgi:UDP-glucose 4-epimerase